MAIYRGPGGAGDAVADTTNQSEIATTKASEAAASAAAAATSASSASTSASTASTNATASATSATSAASSASAAATSATNAATSATNALASADDAESAQVAAETAQTAAETAQTAAETAQTAAETAQTAAETAETNAETAQSAAEAARDAALAALDNFDDRYLGQKSSDPSLDNDGNALLTGSLYFNTSSNSMKVYDGSAWLAAYTAGSGVLDDLTDVVITSVATGNVLKYNGTNWVNSTDYATSAQGALADSAVQPGDNVSDLTNDAGYLTSYTETDPVYVASSWYTTTNNASNWDTAYGWGNHASAGYLTSFTETDPIVGAVTGIVKADGAGNISAAVAGTDYLASFTETNDLTAAVTWANVPDANITQSSVTQHQAALSITEGQISNLGSDIVLDSDIGVSVQGYDADTAKTDTAQTFTASQRGTVTTDNDGSFDLSVTNNFKCTAAASPTDLTFTNLTAGQSGFILLDNSGAYTIGQGTGTKVSATALATLSTAGVYLLSYFTDGTNVYVVNSGALA